MDWEVDILYLMECYDDIRGQKGIAAISVKCRCVWTYLIFGYKNRALIPLSYFDSYSPAPL